MQTISGSSRSAAKRQIGVGTIMAQAEAAHDLDKHANEHPEDELLARLAADARPWHVALGDAVASSIDPEHPSA